MKKIGKILWGVAFIVAGIIFALNAFGITNINIFFDGWWTLFIIIPCLVGLFGKGDKTGSIIGLVIGVFLLLCSQDLIGFDMMWKLAIPIIIVIIGLKLVFGAIFGDRASKILKQSRENGGKVKSSCATFSGQKLNFEGETFNGAELTAVFGGVDCDLRGAVIEKDCAVNATAVFGGIDIFVPENVNVKVESNSIFGGVSKKNHREDTEGAVTVYVNATCMFGGVDIK